MFLWCCFHVFFFLKVCCGLLFYLRFDFSLKGAWKENATYKRDPERSFSFLCPLLAVRVRVVFCFLCAVFFFFNRKTFHVCERKQTKTAIGTFPRFVPVA